MNDDQKKSNGVQQSIDASGKSPPGDFINADSNNTFDHGSKHDYTAERNQHLSDSQREWENQMSGFNKKSDDFFDSMGEEEIDNSFVNSNSQKVIEEDYTRSSDDFIGMDDIKDSSDARGTRDNVTGERDVMNSSTITISSDSGRKSGVFGKTLIRNLQRMGDMAVTQAPPINHTLHGAKISYETAGRFVVAPVVGGSVKLAYKSAAYTKLYLTEILNGALIKPEIEDTVRPILKRVLGKRFDSDNMENFTFPLRTKYVTKLNKALASELKHIGLPTNAGKLKKMIKDGKLDKKSEDIAELFIKTNKIQKYIMHGKFHSIRSMKRTGVKLKRSLVRQLRKLSNENDIYTLQGTLLVSRLSYRSVKTAYAAGKAGFKVGKNTAKTVKHTIKKTQQATKAAQEIAKTGGKIGKQTIKTTSKVGRAGIKASSKVLIAGERLAKKLTEAGAKKSARMGVKATSKIVQTASKVAARTVQLTAKVMAYIINLTISIITTLIAVLGPIFLIAFIAVLLVILILGIFKLDGRNIKEDEELAIQQYVDALAECHENMQEELQSLYTSSEYESVSIDYIDKKDKSVYKDYKNVESDISLDNNIRECLCMMSVLFDFDMETLKPTGKAEEKALDKDKLQYLFETTPLSKDDYDGTYQSLIRAYLVCLFNGSHKIDKNVSVTYCEGCVQREVDDSESETGKRIEAYCPGHRKLDVTVITYYFDQIFDCELKKSMDPVNGIDLVGDSVTEQIWFALLDDGYSKEAAAGAIGNLMWESGGGPENGVRLNTTESTGEGIGMVQWSFDRKTAFLNFLKAEGETWPNENVELQLKFMFQELNGSQWSFSSEYDSQYNISYESFKSTSNIELATNAWCACYERCHPWDAHMDTRIEYAQKVYNTYKDKDKGGPAGEGLLTLSPSDVLQPLGNYRITFYAAVGDPNYDPWSANHESSTGARLTEKRSIAVDPGTIPYGTKIYIEGLGNVMGDSSWDKVVFVAEDCGGAINGNDIDIFIENYSSCPAAGAFNLQVYIVK